MEIFGSLIGKSSFLFVKSQNINRNTKNLNWPVQSSYYIMDEFSGLVAPPSSKSFDIFPNPSMDYFNIYSPDQNLNITKINIMDCSGKQVFVSPFENSMKIETSTWANGLYHIILTSIDGTTYSNKIMICR